MVSESLGRFAGGGRESMWWEGWRGAIDRAGIAPTAGPVVGSVQDLGPETGLAGRAYMGVFIRVHVEAEHYSIDSQTT